MKTTFRSTVILSSVCTSARQPTLLGPGHFYILSCPAQMSATNESLCPDWIWLNISNVQ
jgi:hypothetical protein